MVRHAVGIRIGQEWFCRHANALFQQLYTTLLNSMSSSSDVNHLFCFSQGWFSHFLQRHRISLRFRTNTAQQPPTSYEKEIVNWLRFNRRNSQIRQGDIIYRDIGVTASVGRYLLSNICNIDEIPLPFEYLDGRTYDLVGSKTVWIKETRSGWSKRKATLLLCIFADGINCQFTFTILDIFKILKIELQVF